MFSETEKIMLEFFVEREGEGIVNVIRSLDFIDEGILDSMESNGEILKELISLG